MSLPPLTLMPESRLAAQGSNARRSTGPRTPQGKLRSRWNAFRHGQWASGLAWSDESLQHLGEDPEKFKKLREGLLAAQGPVADPLWVLQLEDLARLYWRRQRLERAWEPMTRHAQGCFRAGAHRIESLTPQGALLLKHLDSLDRSIDRKIRLLMRMREVEERRRRGGPDSSPNGRPGESAAPDEPSADTHDSPASPPSRREAEHRAADAAAAALDLADACAYGESNSDPSGGAQAAAPSPNRLTPRRGSTSLTTLSDQSKGEGAKGGECFARSGATACNAGNLTPSCKIAGARHAVPPSLTVLSASRRGLPLHIPISRNEPTMLLKRKERISAGITGQAFQGRRYARRG